MCSVRRSKSVRLVDVHLEDGLVDIVVERDHQRLQILNNLVDVFDDALNGLMLVNHAIDTEGPDGRPTQRGEQHATYRVA